MNFFSGQWSVVSGQWIHLEVKSEIFQWPVISGKWIVIEPIPSASNDVNKCICPLTPYYSLSLPFTPLILKP